jgi:hypothetical protein
MKKILNYIVDVSDRKKQREKFLEFFFQYSIGCEREEKRSLEFNGIMMMTTMA